VGKLIIVSNRVARIREGSANPGGLAVAILEALQEFGGLWFGWSGEIKDAPHGSPKETKAGKITQVTVDLTERDYEEYYRGYSNQSLWPLFHYRPVLSEYSQRTFDGYMRVNAMFASRLVSRVDEGDLIWVHDYHLIPLGSELRRAGITNRLGFFLHTPFPALEVFLTQPNHQALIKALCQYDVVGFQTENDLRAFHDYIRYETRGVVYADGRIEAYGREFVARVFPISIETEAFADLAAKGVKSKQTQKLKKMLGSANMIIGVDRLDYSKGLPNRFDAFEKLLEFYPENRNNVTFVQIAPPSRSDVPEYQQIRAELEGKAGHINGRFADLDWVPLRYLNRSFSRPMLAGIFRLARAGLVTPLRDGMNLVAKEYVAAQDPADPGVLVLSRFAGAARELTGAVSINPYDVEGIAQGVQTALAMSKDERIERHNANMVVLRRNDITNWRQQFMAALAG